MLGAPNSAIWTIRHPLAHTNAGIVVFRVLYMIPSLDLGDELATKKKEQGIIQIPSPPMNLNLAVGMSRA